MNISPNGLNLTKEFEGCKLTAYRDQAGVPTIGYGHVGPDVFEGMTITQAQADKLLEGDMKTAEDAVNRLVYAPLTQNQFDALVDFTYNEGQGTLMHSSILAALNRKNYAAAADALLLYKFASHVENAGLLRRREAERALFLEET